MSRKIHAGRAAGLAGLAALVLTALPILAPAGVAQERERERPAWRGLFRVGMDDPEMRPMLGVLLESRPDGGVAVMDVLDGSPAREAGIVAGDLILSIDGHELTEPLEGRAERDLDQDLPRPEQRLRALLGEVAEGETVTLVVERDGGQLTFDLVPEVLPPYVGLWPDAPDVRERWGEARGWLPDEYEEQLERMRELYEEYRDQYRTYEWAPPGPTRFFADTLSPQRWELRWDGTGPVGRGRHGLDLVDLNPGLGAYFGTSDGVLVADIEDDSPLGLQPGDVVVAVDGRVVDDIDELHRILGSYQNHEEIAFRIFRDGARTTVTGTIN